MNKKEKGLLGEKLAEKFLVKRGYKILNKNLKLGKLGEIDILCCKQNFLNIVEVKSLFNSKSFLPEIHFNGRKMKKLKNLANIILRKHPNFENCIISLVCLSFEKQKVKIRYYENITL